MTHWKDYASSITDTFEASECALLIVDVQTAFCSPTGQTGRKHANTQMQALPEKINDFAKDFRALGGLPIYIKSVPDNESSTDNQKWLDRLKGIPRPTTKDNPELDLFGLELPLDAIIIEKKMDGFAHSNLKNILD